MKALTYQKPNDRRTYVIDPGGSDAATIERRDDKNWADYNGPNRRVGERRVK